MAKNNSRANFDPLAFFSCLSHTRLRNCTLLYLTLFLFLQHEHIQKKYECDLKSGALDSPDIKLMYPSQCGSNLCETDNYTFNTLCSVWKCIVEVALRQRISLSHCGKNASKQNTASEFIYLRLAVFIFGNIL